MRRLPASDIVLKALGLLLLTAAALKGHELLTVPVANKDLWSWRPFLIFQVEFELALAIWLSSGVFKRLAWLAALACFSLFCCVTLYKGLTGAASCGCFGTVHINPWITLLAVDLPAVAALGLFRPESVLARLASFLQRREPTCIVVRRSLDPFLTSSHLTGTAILGLCILGVTTSILALNRPAMATSAYEVLEPTTWIGKELPILEHIDIAERIRTGTWLLLFYHHDCPNCQRTIPAYEEMAYTLVGNEEMLRIALLEVPPYGRPVTTGNCPCTMGRMEDSKEWFVTTPLVALANQGVIRMVWERKAPDVDAVMEAMR